VTQNPTNGEALITSNPGFETGDFSGWTVVNEAHGSGNWFVYSGTLSPLSGFTIPAPPNGAFAATTDQGGPGSHILYQDLVVPAVAPPPLTFVSYYENRAGIFFTPPTLDALSSGPNQQYRIDLMNPAAPVDSVVAGDILLNIFQTQVGDPPTMAPRRFIVDLTPFAGQTVRLRFAEVDNQFFFQAGVDDGFGSGAPVMSSVGLITIAMILLFVGAGSVARRARL